MHTYEVEAVQHEAAALAEVYRLLIRIGVRKQATDESVAGGPDTSAGIDAPTARPDAEALVS